MNLKNKVILEQQRKMNRVLCWAAGWTEPLCFGLFFPSIRAGTLGCLCREGAEAGRDCVK